MPAELVSCPECKRKLRVPNDLVGKQVKCPTCGQTFTADPAEHSPPTPPPTADEKPARTSKVGRDEEEDRSRRRAREDDDDDDEDRSRRRRALSGRDDDDDDRPRRRSRYSRDDDDDDDDDRRRRNVAPHRGGAVMTMGILGLVLTLLPVVPLVGLVLAIIAWVMGNTDLAEMRAGRMDRAGEGQTNGGRICGIIVVILHVVGILLIFALCCAVGLGGAAGGRR